MRLRTIDSLHFLLPLAHLASAYIPAVAVSLEYCMRLRSDGDMTSSATTDPILRAIQMDKNAETGSSWWDSAKLSRQLTADPIDADGNFTGATSTVLSWTKYAKGVLVHYSENQTAQAPSSVPWIAMIDCDTNGTIFSDIDDIFTLARDHGAQAALLYSVTSQGCLINQDYLQNFQKPLDVYATRDIQSARLIENQFGLNVGASAYTYNSGILNSSSNSISQLLASDSLDILGDIIVTSIISPSTTFLSTISSNTGYLSSTDDSSPTPTPTTDFPQLTGDTSGGSTTFPAGARFGKRAVSTMASTAMIKAATPSVTAQNYLGAVMAASNMTVGPGALNGSTTAVASPTATSGGGGGPNTGLAMIILYAITGVVTFMFLVVILSGVSPFSQSLFLPLPPR
ncbi:hypothetical protein P7C70_g8891, partial [Phenoliferia sp. Uapishka_3]